MDLEFIVNNHSHAISKNELVLFLGKLSNLNSFLIFFIRDEENIDNSYKIHTKGELIDKICECLLWSSPKGAVFIKS
jgi:hypothetical protein